MSGQLPLPGAPAVLPGSAGQGGAVAAGAGRGSPAAAPAPAQPSEARIRTLAGTLAGYRWPGQGGKLRRGQQAAAEAAARVALQTLAGEPD